MKSFYFGESVKTTLDKGTHPLGESLPCSIKVIRLNRERRTFCINWNGNGAQTENIYLNFPSWKLNSMFLIIILRKFSLHRCQVRWWMQNPLKNIEECSKNSASERCNIFYTYFGVIKFIQLPLNLHMCSKMFWWARNHFYEGILF